VRRELFDDEHELYRSSVRRWIQSEVVPHHEEWEQNGIVPRDLFVDAARHGFIGMAVPEQFGGAGVEDFRFNVVLTEEIQRAGVAGSGLGLTLHNDICLPYLLRHTTEEQALRWLPGVATGHLITAVAMSEPGTGSDLGAISTKAERIDGGFLVNGQKTFVSNGINADLVITAVSTAPGSKHRGLTLMVLERGMSGFERGRNLEKIGLHAQDTAELFFTDVVVPSNNVLAEPGAGFSMLMAKLPQERISIAAGGVAAARTAIDWTMSYIAERRAFGQSIGSFQHSRFTMAELATAVQIGQTFVDRCIVALNDGSLTGEDAAMAKGWCTELQRDTVDRCLQLFGGYGYMREFPIARSYTDARVATIYGGTTEIMKEIIGRSMGL